MPKYSLLLALGAVAAAVPLAAQEPQPARRTPTAVVVSGPETGQRAPDFQLPWASKDSIGLVEDDFVLRNLRGRTVVLAFYPADFTTGCTAEMKAFTDRYAELFGEGEDVVVVGISADSLESHKRFAESLGVPFRLLSDPDQRVARLYGSNGENRPRRTVYVIGPDGDVRYRDMRFGALDPRSYDALKKAVQATRAG
ncbi:MAG TPA: peroxiredoxin [Gemmatimonadales bacterium]|nr:peroxiredoxin [Gemmatimonadales bacterium]